MFVQRNEMSREANNAQAEEVNVGNMVNDLLRSFIDIFNGSEFLRMRA